MALSEITEQYIPAGVQDSKGRWIGYTVGFRNSETTYYAWVQNTRRVKGVWKDFGVRQRAKQFATQEAATAWAFATAKERIAELNKPSVQTLMQAAQAMGNLVIVNV